MTRQIEVWEFDGDGSVGCKPVRHIGYMELGDDFECNDYILRVLTPEGPDEQVERVALRVIPQRRDRGWRYDFLISANGVPLEALRQIKGFTEASAMASRMMAAPPQATSAATAESTESSALELKIAKLEMAPDDVLVIAAPLEQFESQKALDYMSKMVSAIRKSALPHGACVLVVPNTFNLSVLTKADIDRLVPGKPMFPRRAMRDHGFGGAP